MNIGLAGSLVNFLLGTAQLAIGNIVVNSTGEQENVLLHNANVAAQGIPGEGADVAAINGNSPGGDFIKAGN